MYKATETQQRVLNFIGCFKQIEGYPPTRTEIAQFFGWSSPNAAQCHLKALEAKGLIRITHRAARGIVIT